MSAAKTVPLAFTRRSNEDLESRSAAFRANLVRRRTVRDFAPTPVPRRVIAEAIATAATAPSGANQQPWTFVAISDPDIKRRIRDAAEAEEKAFYAGRAGADWLEALAPLGTGWEKPFLETAPWLIVVFQQRWGVAPDGSRIKHYYVPESVGIACGFLIAALHDAGLATLTHTPAPMGFLTDICGRPEHEKPVILLVVGHPTDDCRVPAIDRKPFDTCAVFLES